MTEFNVLVTDDIDPDGLEILRASPRLIVDERPTMSRDQLRAIIGTYDAFIGRSATHLQAELLHHASRLRVIGRAGVGIDNIDIPAATALGIAVINAPAGNTVSVAELFFGSLISLLRHLPAAASSMRDGRWDRSLLLGSELRGRTLGIVGLGRIGGEVARRARAFEMTVLSYDPYVTDQRFESLRVARAATLDELVAAADIITVHTPLTDETRGMIGERELASLKPDAIVANMARGGIVDEDALAKQLAEGRLRGALLDVYQKEPLAPDHPLRRFDNVVLTPHLGASTAEGQRNVALDVCESVRDALLTGELSRAINVGGVSHDRWMSLQPVLLLTQRAARVARVLLAERGGRAIDQISLRLSNDLVDAGAVLLSAAAVGVLEDIANAERLNLVNARSHAESRGLMMGTTIAPAEDVASSISVTVNAGATSMCVGGSALGSVGRFTRIGEFTIDVTPRRTLLVLRNRDVPGVIGRVGTLLGAESVNIAEYHQSRVVQGGDALAAVSLDAPLDESQRQRLLALPDIYAASVVNFEDGVRLAGDDTGAQG
jgi:D-3-phosphoglycerate dehydrogenase / 2-oxoglutarate reductase